MGTSVLTLGEAFPIEQARVRRILGYYREIGPVGNFGAAMIEDVLQRADQAAVAGDVVVMMRIYQEMQDVKE